MMKRTISGMIGAGSLAHNRRDFVAENVDPKRTQYNICYRNENLHINVNIKMYIFDHLRMYIFAILPLDRYIFLSDKIFL